MSTEDPLSRCPKPETLSCWLDKEAGDGQEAVGSHLNVCRQCSETVSAYRRIDRGVGDLHSDRIPAALAGRIKRRCRSIPRVEAPVQLFPAWIWKAAAVLALVLAGSALYSSRQASAPGVADNSQSGGETSVAADSAAPMASGDLLYAPTIEMPESLDLRRPVPQTLSATSVTPVGGQIPAFRIGHSRAMQPVPKTVRHVWLVPEVHWEDVQGYLQDHYPESEWEQGSNGLESIGLSMPDTALQALVDRLDTRGADLVSGTPPQPREAATTAFTGRDVGYRMVFIVQR